MVSQFYMRFQIDPRGVAADSGKRPERPLRTPPFVIPLRVYEYWMMRTQNKEGNYLENIISGPNLADLFMRLWWPSSREHSLTPGLFNAIIQEVYWKFCNGALLVLLFV